MTPHLRAVRAEKKRTHDELVDLARKADGVAAEAGIGVLPAKAGVEVIAGVGGWPSPDGTDPRSLIPVAPPAPR
jgi:hypothetical protein